MIFALLFLIIPTLYLVAGAFLTPEGDLTLKNIADLFTPSILSAYWISIKVSVASALGGALIGFFLAWAVVLGGLPNWVRSALLTFSGVASQFRRRAACLRLPRHPRTHRSRDRFDARLVRLQSLFAPASTC